MKHSIFLVLTFVLITILSCTKDSTSQDEENPQTNKNTNSSEVSVNRNLYSEDIVGLEGAVGDFYFGYNEDGSINYFKDAGYFQFSYSTESITLSTFSKNGTFKYADLEKKGNGFRITNVRNGYHTGSSVSIMGFEYDNNGFVKSIALDASNSTSHDSYTFENDGNNITKETYVYYHSGKKCETAVKYEYSKEKNELPLDVNVYLNYYGTYVSGAIKILWMAGYMGRRSNNLISKYTITRNNGIKENSTNCTYEFTYDKDSMGRITRVDYIIYDNILNTKSEKETCNIYYAKYSYTLDDLSKEEYVDLGLDVLWASHNEGAENPTDLGKASKYNKDDAEFDSESLNTIPTSADFNQLYKNATIYSVEINGVWGLLCIGKNGNKIFIPAHLKSVATTSFGQTYFGYYWTSTPTYAKAGYKTYITGYKTASFTVSWGVNMPKEAGYGDFEGKYSGNAYIRRIKNK